MSEGEEDEQGDIYDIYFPGVGYKSEKIAFEAFFQLNLFLREKQQKRARHTGPAADDAVAAAEAFVLRLWHARFFFTLPAT